jgi:hypothetical protein
MPVHRQYLSVADEGSRRVLVRGYLTDRFEHTDRPAGSPASYEFGPRESEILLLDLGEIELVSSGIRQVLGDDEYSERGVGQA